MKSTRGGARPGAGRKPKDKARADKRLMVRLLAEQWERLQAIAKANKMAVSEYVRLLVIERLL